MKIVLNKNNGGMICHVQVKDFLRLARIRGDKKFAQYYVHFINKGKGDFDFIDISESRYIDDVLHCSEIANFMDYKDMAISDISQQIVQWYTFLANTGNKNEENSKISDLRDIIAYKKGELGYPIPLVLDSRLTAHDEDHKLFFSSSIIKDCYVIKTIDHSLISSIDYEKFLNKVIDEIFQNDYPSIDIEDRKVAVHVNDDNILIVVNNTNKKKSLVGNILSKIIKVNK